MNTFTTPDQAKEFKAMGLAMDGYYYFKRNAEDKEARFGMATDENTIPDFHIVIGPAYNVDQMLNKIKNGIVLSFAKPYPKGECVITSNTVSLQHTFKLFGFRIFITKPRNTVITAVGKTWGEAMGRMYLMLGKNDKH
jgi:hypothetical protein